MLLVCKKMTKGNYPYKLIRPKYMIDRMIQFPKYISKTNKDLSGLVYVVVDDVGSSYTSFVLSETAKDPNPLQTLRTWELKVREAKMSYDLSVWFARNPHRDLSEMEMDSSDYSIFSRGTPEDSIAETEARERVAVMLHRSIGTSTEYDITQSITTDSFEGCSGKPGRAGLRHLIHRTSTASSRNSRLSSFQQSTSAASHDEPHAGPSRLYKPGISCEHTILPPHGTTNITSITVNVVSESESDTAVSTQQEVSQASKSPDKSSESQKTLQVQTQNNVVTLVHSLPDLTIEPSTPRSTSSPTVASASEKLYQSHQELLQRNRLVVAQQHQYLTPDHRGSSYPPPSPTRASLKRGLAFSYSFKNPPLTKMGHVNSQSQVQVETASTSSSHGKIDISPSPKAGSEKSEKKTKLMSSRNKDADDDEQAGPSRGEDRRE
ncbi:uncharacterized protein LOC121739113 [Aricia agestis]|uniref:uncharacterized protein LOC121739113 n=1 Tax=Aricia agestis TaxID=91739 RepID=UPI001C20B423|nr:uncharacterized protein LOC121739113 [Aricia agestis]